MEDPQRVWLKQRDTGRLEETGGLPARGDRSFYQTENQHANYGFTPGGANLTADPNYPQISGETIPPVINASAGQPGATSSKSQSMCEFLKGLFSNEKQKTGHQKLIDFMSNVKNSIESLNELQKKTKAANFSEIQPFALHDNQNDNAPIWNQFESLTEIQDAKGCFTYNPYRRLMAVWKKDSITLF